MLREVASQPECWREVGRRRAEVDALFAESGGRMALVGCGTSYYVAAAAARLREDARLGASDPFPASEVPFGRHYPWVLAVSRTGTTTEVIRAVESLAGARRLVICADGNSPLAAMADRLLLLDFADERSVVQTRFATTTLVAVRTYLGEDVDALAGAAEEAISDPLPCDAGEYARIVFVGRGWCAGLAAEASLKMTEAAGAMCQWYPAMEVRHGPISSMDGDTLVWLMGKVDGDLVGAVRSTGARLIGGDRDPLVELVLVQRTAEDLARKRERDPDAPPHLGRSVILS